MNIGKMLWAIGGVLLVGLLSSLFILRNQEGETGVDIVAVNTAVKAAEAHWEEITRGDLNRWKVALAASGGKSESGLAARLTLIAGDGRTLYAGEDAALSIHDALRNGDTVADITVGGVPAGKLIMASRAAEKEKEKAARRELYAALAVSWMVCAALCAAYLLYLHRSVIRPFNKLQSFAQQVARGNLDLPLAMDRNRLFGAFTESFDLMREELAAARESEYRANLSKKELVASLSHDIKTPVASIKAVTELMLLSPKEDRMRKRLEAVLSKAEQIDGLVTNLFHATLEELEQLKVVPTEEYSGVLGRILGNACYGYDIRIDVIPECMLMMDVLRMQQVVDNLLANAGKYAGTPVEATFAAAGDYLVMRIEDKGEGVPKSDLPLLFNKFYRGSNSAGHGGSGLGLYLSRSFMRRMEGDLVCYNTRGGFAAELRLKLV
ncbi:Signal transduction histidine kinase [Paenibacillus sophorae]|uniref:histidine kinase n=1 Tax=Paenibacillus sophorae TaxID=1333845 RepID=A0A1H8SPS2_9BACL|nr:HAMP domain-containing sensor histidine kinase [Paenibacillus sophorae]QWU15512.1 HAMP domain-containing histidine kinase [Paenibacillus sophorae]SEO80641.1 Signal transduction histidine kinase [Paenibacillus sophorae]